jgi:hypothetical protein
VSPSLLVSGLAVLPRQSAGHVRVRITCSNRLRPSSLSVARCSHSYGPPPLARALSGWSVAEYVVGCVSKCAEILVGGALTGSCCGYRVSRSRQCGLEGARWKNSVFALRFSLNGKADAGGGCVGLSDTGTVRGVTGSRLLLAAPLGRCGTAISNTVALGAAHRNGHWCWYGVGIPPTPSGRCGTALRGGCPISTVRGPTATRWPIAYDERPSSLSEGRLLGRPAFLSCGRWITAQESWSVGHR